MYQTFSIYLSLYPISKTIILFFLGLIIGSFLNVVIYRLPHADYQSDNEIIFKLFLPNSFCRGCKTTIIWYKNIPIISYLFLKGKCSNCNMKISLMYPLVELLTGVLFALCALLTSDLFTLLGYLVFTSFLIALALIDTMHFILPDELTLGLLWISLLLNLNGDFSFSVKFSIIGAVCGYLLLWAVYWLYFAFTRKEGIGYGDFKLFAAILAFLGIHFLPLVLLIASMLGIVYFFILKFLKKVNYNSPLPLGLFLSIAGYLTLFLKNYYLN